MLNKKIDEIALPEIVLANAIPKSLCLRLSLTLSMNVCLSPVFVQFVLRRTKGAYLSEKQLQQEVYLFEADHLELPRLPLYNCLLRNLTIIASQLK